MGFRRFFSAQARQPSGLFGRWIMSLVFDKGNAVLNDFAKETLALKPGDHVLEIGFGTGKLIWEMAQIVSKGRVEGIDFSETMARMAARRNKRHIHRGRVSIEQGDFDQKTYSKNRFGKVCAINTIYFWPDPESTLKRIFRILKPGGQLVLAFEDKAQLKGRPLNADLFRIYEEDEVKDLLRHAGFTAVEVRSKDVGSLKFHCALAEKPVFVS